MNTTIERPATADTPLTDFVIRWYMTSPHHRSGKIPKKAVLYKMLRVVEHLDSAINRVPVVRDLNKANLEAVANHVGKVLCRRASTILQARDAFKALWRYAADLGLVSIEDDVRKKNHIWNPDHRGNGVKLSAEPGSLWHICLKQFFPRNLRIRADDTKRQYQYALRDFKQHLGHEPTPADLTEDNVTDMMRVMMERDLSAQTVNERKGRLVRLWRWLWTKGVLTVGPTVENIPEPKRIPKAFTRDELNKLLEACRHVGGKIGDVWASDWWVALHLVEWDSGKRIGSLIACRWEFIDWATAYLSIPGEVRKGQADAVYPLGSDTLDALTRIRDNGSEYVFAMPGKQEAAKLYAKYKALKRQAGLPVVKGEGFQKMRRSVASHLHAAGANATDALGHASADVTRKHYLDPRITGGPKPCDVLFRLDEGDVALLPSEPKLIEYRQPEAVECDPALAWL